MKKILNFALYGLGILIVLFGVKFVWNMPTQEALAGVPIANEYQATSTWPGSWPAAAQFVVNRPVNLPNCTTKCYGALGSVVITGAASGGHFIFYDATTTNASLRSATMATSTIVLATFPKNTAAGTYVFDANYKNGLIVEFIGAIATTTITWR